MAPSVRFLPLLCAVVLGAGSLAAAERNAEPRIEYTPTQVAVMLDGGVELHFALHGDLLLGLHRASVGGVELKSAATCQWPIIAEEYPVDGRAPRLVHALRLKSVEPRGAGVAVVCEMLATDQPQAFAQVFVMRGDLDAADAAPSPDMQRLRPAADAATAAFHAACLGDEAYAKAQADVEKRRAELAAATTPRKQRGCERKLATAEGRLRARAAELRAAQIAANPALAAHAQAQAAYDAARTAHAGAQPCIHRDFYEFAHLRLPAELCCPEHLRALATSVAPAQAVAVGTLTWLVEPHAQQIAGWPWVGWQQQLSLDAGQHLRVNSLRLLGTWELGGSLDGLGVAALRYRGLGRIEQRFTTDAQGVARECFSTTEVIPGATGAAPLISPVVPSSTAVNDRGYSLRHRMVAWISKPARGAGAPFVDWQARGDAIHASFPLRQGCLRALSEVHPGDAQLSQTDEEWFALGGSFTSTPQVHLVLRGAGPLPPHEQRTRWMEVDQHVRDLVATELGFVAYEALPAVGFNFDSAFGMRVKGLVGQVDRLAELGVKQIYVHHPGWHNGRDREPGSPEVPGGDCAIFDWKPLTSVREPWREAQTRMARHGIAYFVWLTGMSAKGAGFHAEVGSDLKHWAINAPGKTTSSGYPPDLYNHNIFDERCRSLLLERLDQVRSDVGYQGFWADSFQNLFMSTLDWSNGTGASMQRAWWQQLATWSRQGIAWCSESHSFPGLSCSIEVEHDPEGSWCYFMHVQRWYRTDFPHAGTAQADRLAFRIMANKGWAAPQGSGKDVTSIVPGFQRLAHEYLAALPSMRRPYQLPGEQGVLWLPFASDSEGVWFSFGDQPVPPGISAARIADGAAATRATAHATYRVQVAAGSLLGAFGVQAPPQADGRSTQTYQPPGHTWPAWATIAAKEGTTP